VYKQAFFKNQLKKIVE